MRIAKWLRDRLGGHAADDADAAPGPDRDASVDEDELDDDEDADDPSVYPLW